MIRNMILLISLCILMTGCSDWRNTDEMVTTISYATEFSIESSTESTASSDISTENSTVQIPTEIETVSTTETQAASLINADGMTLKERFYLPEGYHRFVSEEGSFAEFLQSLPLKPDGSKVKYFDGREKARDVYMAVVDYTLGDRDLQQCADAVMRLRAEYLYASDQQGKISFNFVSGFTANFSKWAAGYGVSVDGNNVSWVKNNNHNDSYESFQKYLNIIYAYSSTLSLEKELVSKDIEDISIGDVFIIGGSPGHCVIVVDMAVNEDSGEKAFILAQSYMPAQDIQILKSNEEGSPWYSNFIEDKLITPEWTFEKTQLKTWE